MQTRTSTRLTPRDFTCVYEVGIGPTYQNGPYMIQVGRGSYAVAYRGQTISWAVSFLDAVETCARHDAVRRAAGTN
jgi:hypothetical protein